MNELDANVVVKDNHFLLGFGPTKKTEIEVLVAQSVRQVVENLDKFDSSGGGDWGGGFDSAIDIIKSAIIQGEAGNPVKLKEEP